MEMRAPIILCFALAGCGSQPPSVVEVADVNGRNALARVSQLSDRVDELERQFSRLDELETEVRQLTREMAETNDNLAKTNLALADALRNR
jgi:outer membrane murein-binding lipoprotein Lpp